MPDGHEHAWTWKYDEGSMQVCDNCGAERDNRERSKINKIDPSEFSPEMVKAHNLV